MCMQNIDNGRTYKMIGTWDGWPKQISPFLHMSHESLFFGLLKKITSMKMAFEGSRHTAEAKAFKSCCFGMFDDDASTHMHY